MNAVTATSSATAVAAALPQTRTFLPYIDGLRGFFGLYIGLAHLWFGLSVIAPATFSIPYRFAAFGHTTIALFIVASGYVIGLPVARDGQTFRGGLRTFARRRGRRLLPAYYAALVLAVPISWYCAALYGEGLPTRSFIASILLHLLMLHNLSDGLLATIDGPMWSVAVECDIYIMFAIFLAPLAKRFGFTPMVFGAFALGLIPTLAGFLRHNVLDYRLAQTCPWYLGLFALGYAAANLTVTTDVDARHRIDRVPWGIIAITFAVAAIAAVAATPLNEASSGNGDRWLSDVLIGIAIASQFLADAHARARGSITRFERFFTWQPLLFLGTFSYSYYLVHVPLMQLVMAAARPNWPRLELLALAAAALVVTLIGAYGFYRVAELPFMTSYRRRGDAASLRSSSPIEIVDPVAPVR